MAPACVRAGEYFQAQDFGGLSKRSALCNKGSDGARIKRAAASTRRDSSCQLELTLEAAPY